MQTLNAQLVADKDAIVGFLVALRGGTRRLSHRADFTMAVKKSHNGKGFARELLRKLEEWAVEQGLQRIELTVMGHNTRAVSLYEKAGFTREGVKKGAILIRKTPIDEWIMGKSLPERGYKKVVSLAHGLITGRADF